MSDQRILGCIRVADLERPPTESDMTHCQQCGMAVWRAHSTPKGEDRLFCIPCMMDDIQAQKDAGATVVVEPPTAAQLADIHGKSS